MEMPLVNLANVIHQRIRNNGCALWQRLSVTLIRLLYQRNHICINLVSMTIIPLSNYFPNE